VKDVVNVGDVVTVKITGIDTEKKRISLSMRAVAGDDEAPAEEADEVVYSDEAPAAEAEAPAADDAEA
jgi:4-hydroxy-3-methylbut-2-enyl diphosphate reductase